MFPAYLRISQQCMLRGVDFRHYCHCPTKRRFPPSFHCVEGYSFWSWWWCLHCCTPSSFSTLDWQEKYSKCDIGSQNTPKNNRPMPTISSSPWEMTEDSSSLPLSHQLFEKPQMWNIQAYCPQQLWLPLTCWIASIQQGNTQHAGHTFWQDNPPGTQ